MRSCRLAGILVTLLVAGSALSACGGDDGGAPNAFDEDTIAKGDFIQAANEACETRAAQIEAKGRRVYAVASKKSRDAGAKLLIEQVVVPGFEREIRDLRALQPPPGDEEEVEGLITALQEMVDRTRGDLAKGRSWPYRKTENLAAAYGLPACGHP